MVKIEVAEPKDRFVAAAIDFVPPFLLFLLFAVVGANGLATLTSILGALYYVGRDALGNGQSPGKRFRNLQVVDADTDRVPDTVALLLRNLGFLVPGLNLIYAIIEGVQVIRHPQGLRFGDVFAQTGVVQVPKEDREKLLVKPTERKSRDNIPKVEAPDATAPSATPATAAPAASGAVPQAPASKPSVSGPIPGFGGAGASAPKKAPAPIDLPPDTTSAPKPASTAAPAKPAPIGTPPPPRPAAAPNAAPLPPIPGAGGAPGVAMSDDDPLKKLIEKAGAKT